MVLSATCSGRAASALDGVGRHGRGASAGGYPGALARTTTDLGGPLNDRRGPPPASSIDAGPSRTDSGSRDCRSSMAHDRRRAIAIPVKRGNRRARGVDASCEGAGRRVKAAGRAPLVSCICHRRAI